MLLPPLKRTVAKIDIYDTSLLKFLGKYGFIFLIVLPTWTVAGNASSALLTLLVPLTMLFLYFRGMFPHIILLFITALILGDSRTPVFASFGEAKVIMVISMTLLTVLDFYYGKYGYSNIITWLLPFFFLAMVSLIDTPVTIRGFLKTCSFFLIYFVHLNFTNYYLRYYGRAFAVEILVFCQLVLGLGLVLIPIFPELVFFKLGFRYRGMFGNPNGVGAFASYVFILTQVLYPYFGSNLSKTFKVLMNVFIAISLVMCASRTSIGIIVLYMLLRGSFKGNLFRRALILFGILPLVLVVSRMFTIYDFLQVFGLSEFFRTESIADASGRTHAWTWAWGEVMKNPLLGKGFTYDDILFFYGIPTEILQTGHYGGVHNSFLVFLINTGFIGLILYMVFFVRLMLRINNIQFLIPLFGSLLFAAFLESWLSASLNFIVTMFLLCYLFIKVSEDEWENRNILRGGLEAQLEKSGVRLHWKKKKKQSAPSGLLKF